MEYRGFADIADKRRSVRRYQDRPVEREKILKCVDSARLAPSACNSQPWRYFVIDNPSVKSAFCAEVFSGLNAPTAFAGKAPVIVALTSNKGNWLSAFGGRIKDTAFCLVDIGITSAHFILQAEELGLGTCLLGWFDREKADKFLNLPEGERTELLISVGYPAETPSARPRKKLEEMSKFLEEAGKMEKEKVGIFARIFKKIDDNLKDKSKKCCCACENKKTEQKNDTTDCGKDNK